MSGKQGRHDQESEEVVIAVDKKGEKELLSENSSSEEGEADSSEELDNIDEDELKQVYEEKRRSLEHAKEDLKKQEEEEQDRRRKEKKEKRKRIAKLLSKIKQVENETDKVKHASRHNTPNSTPASTPRGSPEATPRKSNGKAKTAQHSGKKSQGKQSLNNEGSLKLPTVGSKAFVELVTEALNKGVSMAVANEKDLISEKDNDIRENPNVKHSIEKAIQRIKHENNGNEAMAKEALIEALCNDSASIHNNENSNAAKGVIAPAESNYSSDNCNHDKHVSKESQLFSGDKENKKPRKNKKERKLEISSSSSSSSDESSGSSNRRSSGKKKKLKSGRCADPDMSDIKCTVKYPHERLNLQFVKNRKYDKLSFHLLVAGELELIQDGKMRNDEKTARLAMLKMLAYHKEYLETNELRDAYDSVMEEVEKGRAGWDDNLADKIHTFCEFRANLLTREQITKQQGTKQISTVRKDSKDSRDKTIDDRVVFCADFNNNTCKFTDHHEGRFSNKQVTKWHICKKCYLENRERNSHAENDPRCPRRN